MTLEEFIDRHKLKQIPEDQPFPEALTPYEESDEDEYRFFINGDRTVGLAVNDTKDEIRVVYAELSVEDTGWIPLAEAVAVTGLD